MAETFDAIHVLESISVGNQDQQGARLEIKSPLDGNANRFVADAAGIVQVGGNRANGLIILLHEESTPDGEGFHAIALNGSNAEIQLGGIGKPGTGQLILKDPSGTPQITLSGHGGRVSAEQGRYREIVIIDNGGTGRIGIDGNTATLRIGFQDKAGHVILRSERGETIHLDSEQAEIQLGGAGKPGTGRIILQDPDGTPKITLSGHSGRVSAEQGRYREIVIIDNGGTGRIGIDGNTATLQIGFQDKAGHVILRSAQGETIHLDGQGGNARLGGNGADGDLLLFSRSVTDINSATKATVHLDGQGGNARLGGNGADGDLLLFAGNVTDVTDATKARIHLDAEKGNIWAGGNGTDGDLALFSKNTNLVGVTDPAEKAKLATIHLNGDAGDIILRNADCAEEFNIGVAAGIEAGSVLIIATENELMPCTQAYDKRVAGVVSGAGNYKPGILLDRQQTPNLRLPIALMGKVYCKVDAGWGAIAVGDLLTSSATPGHAMKANDPIQAIGAIIGKALSPLVEGKGLIPVLVALQ